MLMQIKKENLFLFQLQICGSSSACRKKTRCGRMALYSAAILRYLSMRKFPWKFKYMAKYILEAFFLTTFPSTKKKMSKIYAVTLVLPFNLNIRVPLESVNLFLHVFLCLKVSLTTEHYIKLLKIFIWKFAIFWSWQLVLWNLGQLAPA